MKVGLAQMLPLHTSFSFFALPYFQTVYLSLTYDAITAIDISYFKGILDYLDNLTTSQIRRLFSMVSSILVQSSSTEAVFEVVESNCFLCMYAWDRERWTF